jgi:hypothetical protein
VVMGHPDVRQLPDSGLTRRRLRVVPGRLDDEVRDAAGPGWLDPAVLALSFQRGDGEWRFSPWLIAGREDLYPGR